MLQESYIFMQTIYIILPGQEVYSNNILTTILTCFVATYITFQGVVTSYKGYITLNYLVTSKVIKK